MRCATAMVLSFARGRARHVVRELVELDFRRDVEELAAHGALLPPRRRRVAIRDAIDARIRVLANLLPELAPDDVLRAAIERACAAYAARAPSSIDGEIAWTIALHDLGTLAAPASRIGGR